MFNHLKPTPVTAPRKQLSGEVSYVSVSYFVELPTLDKLKGVELGIFCQLPYTIVKIRTLSTVKKAAYPLEDKAKRSLCK